MAYSNMFNNEQQKGLYPSNAPRISFSSDFIDTQQAIKHENSYREAPVSSDFQFSLSSYSMISADELFSKGKLLPVKENCNKMTLRDELLADDEFEDVLPRFSKGPGRWKERFGLKRTHVVPNKGDRSEGYIERIEAKRAVNHQDLHTNIAGAN